jgi:hypothetical protein
MISAETACWEIERKKQKFLTKNYTCRSTPSSMVTHFEAFSETIQMDVGAADHWQDSWVYIYKGQSGAAQAAPMAIIDPLGYPVSISHPRSNQ